VTALVFKSGAERFVSSHHFIERAPKDKLIERSVPAHRERHVERRVATWLQLIKQPKAPLRRSGGENEDALTVVRDLCPVLSFGIGVDVKSRRRWRIARMVVPVQLILKYVTTGVSGESRDRLE
jgi:hypothetical protein